MPQRKITIPAAIDLKDPISGAVLDKPLTFEHFIERIFQNPLWNESFKAGLAQLAISKAIKEAVEKNFAVMTIAEEDWEMLDKAVKEPKATIPGGVVPGFGFLPQFARLIIPLAQAIVDAERVPA